MIKGLCDLMGWSLSFIIIHHFPKFSDHKLCGSSDIAAKIVYLTLLDHVNKGSGGFMEGNSTLCISTLQKLIAIDIVLIDI